MTSVLDSLTGSPEEISRLEILAAASREKLDLAKIECECAEATAALANKDAKNQKMLEAKVTLDPAVIEARKEVVRKEAEWRADMARYHEADNLFNSARKLAGIGLTREDIRSSPEAVSPPTP